MEFVSSMLPLGLTNKVDSRQRKSSITFGDIHDDTPNDDKKKKIIHRDGERQRRREMASLHRSLSSLIPLDYLKGKRSICDHMQEAIKYIRHLQKRIDELNHKRDELKGSLSSLNVTYENSTSYQRDSVTVKTCRAGMEIVVSTAMGRGLPLSRLLHFLTGEGLTIVSCISTKVNERLLHTIESKVNDGRSIHQIELQQKLIGILF